MSDVLLALIPLSMSVSLLVATLRMTPPAR
jgi:hypothetical protein